MHAVITGLHLGVEEKLRSLKIPRATEYLEMKLYHEQLGSKVSLYIHRISKKDWSPLPRIADQINGLVKILNTKYTALSEQQAEYLSMDDTRRPAEFNVRLVLVDPLVLFFWFHESTSEKKIEHF